MSKMVKSVADILGEFAFFSKDDKSSNKHIGISHVLSGQDGRINGKSG